MRNGKWIDGIAGEQPVSMVARRTLEVRLAAVWHYLPLAAWHAEEDPEHVHQLRVASRRAMVAVKIFRDLLPKRRARWLRKRLKQIRQTAGAARDDDVLAMRLERWRQRHLPPELVLKQIRRHRCEAQEPIRQIHRQLAGERFGLCLSVLLQKVRWRDNRRKREPSFGSFGRRSLRAFCDDFLAASQEDFGDLASLHQFRIAGKHLRYSIEVFAAAFSPALREVQYPLIEQLQELLGVVNDHASAVERLRKWLEESDEKPLQPGLWKLLAAERRSLDRSRSKFLAWWTPARAQSLRNGLMRRLIDD